MPKNDQFDYEGLQIQHANGWSAHEYHQGQYKREPNPKLKREPLGKLNNVARHPSKTHKPKIEKTTPEQDAAVLQAAAKNWRNLGLSNNTFEEKIGTSTTTTGSNRQKLKAQNAEHETQEDS